MSDFKWDDHPIVKTSDGRVAGPQGPAGKDGKNGAAGPEGPAGKDGSDGAAGARGAQGPKGDKGDKGDAGEKGERGWQGYDGISGGSGSDGPPGGPGPQGVPGVGVPTGGTTGQVLAKASNVNYETTWETFDVSGFVPYSGAIGAVNIGVNSFTSYDLNLPDQSTSGTGVISFSSGIFQFSDGSDPFSIRVDSVYANTFRLYDNTLGEYSYLTISEGAFAALLPDGITLADIAARKINPVAGATFPAIDVANRQLISAAEDIILDWSSGQAVMAHGFFGGLSSDFEGGGYFNFINGSISQYATLSAASYDVNNEWGGNVFFHMNPEEGFLLGYGTGSTLQGSSSTVGLYVGGGTVIEGTTGGIAIGTGLSTTITLNGTNTVFAGPAIFPNGSAGDPAMQFTGTSSNTGIYRATTDAIGFSTDGTEKMRLDAPGRLGIGQTSVTAWLHLRAGGTASASAPMKFTSGALQTTAEVGAVEFLTDKLYNVITTGAARKEITLNDNALTSGRVPFSTTNGRLTDSANVTYTSGTGLLISDNLKLTTAGNGLYIKEGTNATMGVATLAAGTATVSTTKVTANSRIFITIQGGTLTNVGSTYISVRTAGTSFVITSTNILDASTVGWFLAEPA